MSAGLLRRSSQQLVLVSILCLLVIMRVSQISPVYYTDVIDTTNNETKMKYILYWNEAYGSKEYGFCCGQGMFG